MSSALKKLQQDKEKRATLFDKTKGALEGQKKKLEESFQEQVEKDREDMAEFLKQHWPVYTTLTFHRRCAPYNEAPIVAMQLNYRVEKNVELLFGPSRQGTPSRL